MIIRLVNKIEEKYQIRTLFDREIPRTTNTERIPNFQGPGLIVSSSPPCVRPGEPFPTEPSARVVGLFLCGTNYWFRQSWNRRETSANFNSIQHLVPFWKNTISIELFKKIISQKMIPCMYFHWLSMLSVVKRFPWEKNGSKPQESIF